MRRGRSHGYGLQRLLGSLGVRCEVVAASLIPKAPGDKVKTDKRDCRRLARLHRAGELVAIRVSSPTEEAVRDLCRTRGDMVEDLTRARNRLTKFLLRHEKVWRGGSNWTHKHEAWLGALSFSEPGAGLGAYRGVTHVGALGLAAEVCDWRRFERAASFMGFMGLVPSEYSSGGSTRRGHLTKAGNAHIRARVGLGLPAPPLRGSRDGQAPRGRLPRDRGSGLGRPAAAVPGGSGTWRPARTQRPWSPPPWPETSPGSCGRR